MKINGGKLQLFNTLLAYIYIFIYTPQSKKYCIIAIYIYVNYFVFHDVYIIKLYKKKLSGYYWTLYIYSLYRQSMQIEGMQKRNKYCAKLSLFWTIRELWFLFDSLLRNKAKQHVF